MRAIFIEIDQRDSGNVELDVLKTTFSALGTPLSEAHLAILAKNFHAGPDPLKSVDEAKVDYSSLCNFLEYQEEVRRGA